MHTHASTGISIPLPWLILAGALAAYLAAAARQRHTSRGWSRHRTAAFTAGALLLALAWAPALNALAHHDLRFHMLQHLLVGMFAPLALVLAMPVSLLLRTLPRPAARGLARGLQSPGLRALTHPLTALLLNTGGMVLLYDTPLFARSLEDARLHTLVQMHFLLAGSLFAWSIAGRDPAPHRPGMALRLGVLTAAAAAHALLGKLLYAYGLPYFPAQTGQQIQAAAQWMYYGGDLAELLLAVILFHDWYRKRSQSQPVTGCQTPGARSKDAGQGLSEATVMGK